MVKATENTHVEERVVWFKAPIRRLKVRSFQHQPHWFRIFIEKKCLMVVFYDYIKWTLMIQGLFGLTTLCGGKAEYGNGKKIFSCGSP